MITGFEQETAPLDELEEDTLIPELIQILQANKETPLTNAMLRERLSHTIPDTRIRLMINRIRVKHLVSNLIATGKGYYITENQENIRKYILSLNERIDAITAVKNSFIIPAPAYQPSFDFGDR